jgi:hypothetical protein
VGLPPVDYVARRRIQEARGLIESGRHTFTDVAFMRGFCLSACHAPHMLYPNSDMSDPVRVYVDFDDILCDTAGTLTGLLEEHFGKTVEFDTITSFNLGQSFALEPAEVNRLMDLAHEPAILHRMPPLDGAAQALTDWQTAGYEVWIVTGRPPSSAEASEHWLVKQGIPYHRLAFVDKYSRFDHSRDGSPTLSMAELSRIPFRFAVEDSPVMIDFLIARMQVPVFVLERPWNIGHLPADDAVTPMVRCRDWTEIRSKIHAQHT